MKNSAIIFFIIAIVFFSCNPEKEQPKEIVKTVATPHIQPPDFNADSAYNYVKAQVDFGPRVPGTDAHAKCADYLVKKLKLYGMDVMVQNGTVQTYDQKQFNLKNIIASSNPDAQNRVLICSHWDTRPMCESDTKDKDKPGDAANDGASGVGIALEIARQIKISKPSVGVDIIYFDLEDYGENGGEEDSWCLGTQYWATHLHKNNYYANFGILLDMVGGPNAVFVKEGISVEYASSIVDKVWKAANEIGFGNVFLNETKNFVGADDHVYVNRSGTPCIDIIEYNPKTDAFPAYHHTHNDNMEMIDKKTLKAVGQTLLEVIYNEK